MEIKPNIGILAGNFDVIHPGYVHLFKEFNNSCEYQFILLQEDPTIERPEKIKPILSIDERIDMISPFLDCCFFMTYNTEQELYQLIKSLRPDIRVLGMDYIGKDYTGKDLDIPVKWIDRSHNWSTTKYKKLIAETI
jgi:glycerol-3-phosphate cytidylyltransferase